MNQSNKKWEYSLTTSTIWTSFDNGVVYADSREEALELAKKEIIYNLKKANEIWNSCDPTIGFKIEIDLSQIELVEIYTAPTMQCQNTHTFDKVKEVIQILYTLDSGDSVDGETMEYILEQVGMKSQMLRQLVMGNPENIVKELLEEKISLIEKRLECIKRTNKDINEIILDNQDKIYKAVGYDNLEVLQRSISDIGIALDLNDNEPIEQNWYKLFY
jgi:ABC-type uncharacterized transport system ATPase subunit